MEHEIILEQLLVTTVQNYEDPFKQCSRQPATN